MQFSKMFPVLLCLVVALVILYMAQTWFASRSSRCPISVNYHFTRQCNKTCGFCFHTATTSHKEQLPQAQRGLRLLKEAGMQKINFAGGEPFLHSKFLGSLIDYCKDELELQSVSIVTNGSLVTEKFLSKHGHNIDILAVSCDSFREETNIQIGRGSGDQVQKLYQIANWCRQAGIKFKLNTVVCRLNFQEDMNKHVAALQPFRWKCFQVLMVAGENDSEKTLRDVRKFIISDEEYEYFCSRHRQQKAFVPEPNRLMAKSYLILDEYMRFLDRDGRQPSPSILEVGVQRALSSVYWDKDSFDERGGVYDWQRTQVSECGPSTQIEW
jgi:radical S-adenosyl methionine domain-containing protein 2